MCVTGVQTFFMVVDVGRCTASNLCIQQSGSTGDRPRSERPKSHRFIHLFDLRDMFTPVTDSVNIVQGSRVDAYEGTVYTRQQHQQRLGWYLAVLRGRLKKERDYVSFD